MLDARWSEGETEIFGKQLCAAPSIHTTRRRRRIECSLFQNGQVQFILVQHAGKQNTQTAANAQCAIKLSRISSINHRGTAETRFPMRCMPTRYGARQFFCANALANCARPFSLRILLDAGKGGRISLLTAIPISLRAHTYV